MKAFIYTLLFLTLLSGCASTKKSGTGNEYGLNNAWVLQNLGGKQADSTNFPRGLPEMELNVDEKSIQGNTGCNTMAGSMTAAGSSIKFFRLITTRMFCEGVNESGFINALENTDSYTIENNRLFLYSGKIVTAVFTKK